MKNKSERRYDIFLFLIKWYPKISMLYFKLNQDVQSIIYYSDTFYKNMDLISNAEDYEHINECKRALNTIKGIIPDHPDVTTMSITLDLETMEG